MEATACRVAQACKGSSICEACFNDAQLSLNLLNDGLYRARRHGVEQVALRPPALVFNCAHRSIQALLTRAPAQNGRQA